MYMKVYIYLYKIGTGHYIRMGKNSTLDCNNISTITLVFIKLFSNAKNRNIHFKIRTKTTTNKTW